MREKFFDVMRKYNVKACRFVMGNIDALGMENFLEVDGVSRETMKKIEAELASIFSSPESEPGDGDYTLLYLADLSDCVKDRNFYEKGVDY